MKTRATKTKANHSKYFYADRRTLLPSVTRASKANKTAKLQAKATT